MNDLQDVPLHVTGGQRGFEIALAGPSPRRQHQGCKCTQRRQDDTDDALGRLVVQPGFPALIAIEQRRKRCRTRLALTLETALQFSFRATRFWLGSPLGLHLPLVGHATSPTRATALIQPDRDYVDTSGEGFGGVSGGADWSHGVT